MDKNNLYGFSAWAFAPPIKLPVIEIRFGYSYNYSTTQKNHFVSEKTLAKILTNFDSTAQIKGIYNPYFTPRDQSVNSLLASINISPGKMVKVAINANFGFYATAQIPYIFLHWNQISITDSVLEFKTDFVKERFFPWQLNVAVTFSVSKTINIKAEYIYNRTYYFTNHYAGLGLTINFPDGRKTK
jgi:hypothetical protein